jgi:phage-related protein
VPPTKVLFYTDEDGSVPALTWIRGLTPKVRRKCAALVRRLAALGHELRRPAAAHLGHDLYELRARSGRVNVRVLYFFHQRNEAILVHALTKEDRIPESDLDRALRRRERFLRDPERHTHEEEI